MTDRLIALAGGDGSMPRPIRTLAAQHLRRLNDKLEQRSKNVRAGVCVNLYDILPRIGVGTFHKGDQNFIQHLFCGWKDDVTVIQKMRF